MAASSKKGRASAGAEVPDVPADPLVGTRMRVWWPPTTDKNKTGFSGAYWPVLVKAKKSESKYQVEYDNGDLETVRTEDLAPDDPPVDFGQESSPLQAGEFCEVSNNSATDPCAWVAVVTKRLPSGNYMVHYPFHDSPAESIAPGSIRRARVLDMEGWCLLRPNQKWKDGEVTSPHELETIKEEELDKHLNLKAKAESSGASKAKEATSRNGTGASTNGGAKGGSDKAAAGTKRTASEAQLTSSKPGSQRGKS